MFRQVLFSHLHFTRGRFKNMIWVRLIILTACLAATCWYLEQEQRTGSFQRVDDLFLDLLVANTRDRLSQPEPWKDDIVTFVALREEDRADYASWPPPPLDWQTILKGLQPYEPRVLVIATPLNWGTPAPDFVPSVTEALLPFTSVVFGLETLITDDKTAGPAFMGGLENALPIFQRVDGEIEAAPRLSALIAAPDPLLRSSGEIGLLSAGKHDGSWLLPYALRNEETLRPSLLAQTISRHTITPYAWHRLRLGPGAGAYLNGGIFVPLENDGSFKVTRNSVSTVNALNLMTGTVADGLSDADKTSLGKGKIIVIGPDREADTESPPMARLQALALAQMVSLPKIQILSHWQQKIAWGAAIFGAYWIVLRVSRNRALKSGLALIFSAFVISFITFQTSLLWCPPTMPAALITVGAIIGTIFGSRRSPTAFQNTTPLDK